MTIGRLADLLAAECFNGDEAAGRAGLTELTASQADWRPLPCP